MVYPIESIYAMGLVSYQYILWYLPSPKLANVNVSHVHPPHEIPPLYPKHFLPCNMKGVEYLNPFEVDHSTNLTLEGAFV